MIALAATLLMAMPPHVRLPVFPVVIQTDQAAYVKKDHITLTLVNRNKEAVFIEPLLDVDRGEGDGTWTPVYKLRAVGVCPEAPPQKERCVELKAGETLKLVEWDWNTGGDTQCPPRRPGTRAFKGVHRLVAHWCKAKPAPERAESRTKLVTWE